MQSNSKVIGVVVCIVCCIGALCILPLAGSSDNDLQGWNSSQMYDGLINPSDSEFFTDAVLEERANGGLASTPHVSSTGSRMFHHSSASTMSAQGMGMGSSYAGASVHTTSAATMSGSGSSISPISVSSNSRAGGISASGGAIYATSSNVSSRSSSASGSSLISSSALSAPTASRAAAPMMSASSAATSGTPATMYASNMSSNYGTASYGGYGGPKGVRGKQGAFGYDAATGFFSDWLNEIAENQGDAWCYDVDGYSFYLLDKLQDAWNAMAQDGKVSVPDGLGGTLEFTWDDFLTWFFKNGQDSSDDYGDNNLWYRLPIPDGVGVLLVLSLLCVLFTYLRSRDKKILEETEKTH